MDRREALKLTSLMFVGAVIGSEIFLSGCTTDTGIEMISEGDVRLLDEIGETILPETQNSPGAKAAKIGAFMKSIVEDCYAEKEQEIFRAGLASIRKRSKDRYSTDFMEIFPEQKHDLLVALDQEAAQGGTEETHYFSMIKQLSIWGYFTSEPGATKALRYNPIPGEFRGCISYREGEKAWA